ncbi:lipopolysaccharide biosynthesis protein [Pontibacter vulgaris]|uniref:lipopolysaccharide biosynthesis protein n=1 Tax=Pontibacter vulgaris TaxID=2905679 RepID=UPI001FA8164C|nr:lipopolysaccharide biosynthesis protein [Pontibacter vulgaris]
MENASLKDKAAQGVYWTSLQLVVNKFLSFGIKLVLAKVLYPDQFGLVGMAAVSISFITIFNDLGIGSALVQRKEDNIRDEHYHTAFWTGIVWSIVIYLFIYFIAAPFLAAFYKEPLLNKIIPVLSIGVLSSPVNMIHKIFLTKQMNFKKLAFIDNVSNILSGVLALTLAYSGAGVWSLVFNSVASFVIAMPLFFKATYWTPKFLWNKQAFKEIFGFGVYTTGTQVMNILMQNIDYLLIGKLVSAAALGKYTLAFVLTDTFRYQITGMINKVMFPIYSKKQNNHEVVKNMYFKVVKYNSLCVFPFMIFFIVLAEPIVLNFFGEKWLGSIEPLRILALSVMIHGLVNSHAILFRSLGKPRFEMKVQLIKALAYIPIIALGIYWYGVVGAAWAYVITKILEVIIAQYSLKQLLNITFLDIVLAIKVTLLASIAAFIFAKVLYNLGLHFLICTSVLVFVYSTIVWFFMSKELIGFYMSIRKSSNKGAVLV